MAVINLRDFYQWYTVDIFVEVSDDVAAELFADKRYQKSHEQRMRRHKSFYSLDAGDNIETSAIVYSTDDPAAVVEMMERHCRLCQALNSLPEIQGRRVEAHFLLGKSQAEIAQVEGVSKGSVCVSITRGLAAMKKTIQNMSQ